MSTKCKMTLAYSLIIGCYGFRDSRNFCEVFDKSKSCPHRRMCVGKYVSCIYQQLRQLQLDIVGTLLASTRKESDTL